MKNVEEEEEKKHNKNHFRKGRKSYTEIDF